MQCSRLMLCFDSPKKALIVVLFFFNFFVINRIAYQAVNKPSPGNSMVYGNLKRTVARVWSISHERVNENDTFTATSWLLHDRVPAMFMFVSEAWIRLGGETYLPLLYLGLILFNIGLILQASWVSSLFSWSWAGVAASFFVCFSTYALWYSANLHMHSYQFLFFNLAIWALVKIVLLKKKQGFYWVVAYLSYFALCWNYYMFYMSTFVLGAGLFFVYSRYHWRKKTFAWAVVPTIAFLCVIYVTALTQGNFEQGLKRLAEIFVARTVDARIEGGTWYPKERFLQMMDWIKYPLLQQDRLGRFLYLPMFAWLWLFWWARNSNQKLKVASPQLMKFFQFVFFAGFSWQIFMIQHSKIHINAGIFGYFLWMMIFVFGVRVWCEERKFASFKNVKFVTASVVLLSVVLKALFLYVSDMSHLWKNIT